MMPSPQDYEVSKMEINIIILSQAHIITGTRVGRLRVIFKLPEKLYVQGQTINRPSTWPSSALAYVEWLSPLRSAGHHIHNMYGVSKVSSPHTPSHGDTVMRPGVIIPLTSIRQSCMLFPSYGPPGNVDPLWESENILDTCTSFYVNNWASKYAYQTIW